MGVFQQIDKYKKATPRQQRDMLNARLDRKEYAELCTFYKYAVIHPDGTHDKKPFEELAEKDSEFKKYWLTFVHFMESSEESQDRILEKMRKDKKYREIMGIYEAITAGASDIRLSRPFHMMALKDKEFGKFWREYHSKDEKEFDLTFLKEHLETIIKSAKRIIDKKIEQDDWQWSRVCELCKKMYSLTRDTDYPYKDRIVQYVQKKLKVKDLPEAVMDYIDSGVGEFLHGYKDEDENFDGFADHEGREVEGRKTLDDFFDS